MFARVDYMYNLPLCRLQIRLQHISRTMGNPMPEPSLVLEPYARIDFIPQSVTKNLASGVPQPVAEHWNSCGLEAGAHQNQKPQTIVMKYNVFWAGVLTTVEEFVL